ncbi:MAG: hypothetical protein II896_02815 [Clostridia bacterium]|nr:hypothetical protein [Clostridia bacterium]
MKRIIVLLFIVVCTATCCSLGCTERPQALEKVHDFDYRLSLTEDAILLENGYGQVAIRINLDDVASIEAHHMGLYHALSSNTRHEYATHDAAMGYIDKLFKGDETFDFYESEFTVDYNSVSDTTHGMIGIYAEKGEGVNVTAEEDDETQRFLREHTLGYIEGGVTLYLYIEQEDNSMYYLVGRGDEQKAYRAVSPRVGELFDRLAI